MSMLIRTVIFEERTAAFVIVSQKISTPNFLLRRAAMLSMSI